MRRGKRLAAAHRALLCILFLAACLLPLPCRAAGPGESAVPEAEEMLEEEMDLGEINRALEDIFPEEKPDFQETVAALLSGDLSVSAGLVGEVVSESIFGAMPYSPIVRKRSAFTHARPSAKTSNCISRPRSASKSRTAAVE